MKRTLSALLALSLLLSLSAVPAQAADAPSREQRCITEFWVNEDEIKVPAKMGYLYVDENGRTMIPLRALCDAMGLTVAWDGATQSATVEGGRNGAMVFRIGSTAYTVGGEERHMDTTPVIWAPGRIHVPLRYLVEGAGGQIRLNRFGGSSWYMRVYYQKVPNATPTPPPWAEHDYVTFETTSVYQPEYWSVIQDLRERVLAGENVLDEVQAFADEHNRGRMDKDPGFAYECLLLKAELAARGYNGKTVTYGTDPFGGVGDITSWTGLSSGPIQDDMTDAQKRSIKCWAVRQHAAQGHADRILLPLISYASGMRSYQSGTPYMEGLDRRALFAEYYFDSVREDKDYLAAFGDYVYYDGRQQRRDVAPYQSGGTTLFDLGALCRALNWEMTTGESYALLSDQPLVPKGTVVLRQYSDDWEKDGTGALVISENGHPRWRWSEPVLHTIALQVGSSVAVVDGKQVDLGHAVESEKGINNQWYAVPQSFITGVLGEQMAYDDARQCWFVGQDLDLGDNDVKGWVLGMNAIAAQANPYGDPTQLRMIARGRVDTTNIPGRVQAAYDLYHGWGVTSGTDAENTIRQLSTAAAAGENAAWNAFRASQVAVWSYGYGYLTFETAMELLKPAAQALHDRYGSWDEACADYLAGYLQFRGGDTADELYQLRLGNYEAVKANQEKMGVQLFDDSLFKSPLRWLGA